MKKIQSPFLDFLKTVMQSFAVKKPPRGHGWGGQKAQGLVEYGLILGLIAILIVTIFITFEGIVDLGGDAGGTFSNEGIGRTQGSLSAGIY